MDANTNGKQTRGKPFQPGNKASPGRPPGSKNKLGEDFIAALAADFEVHGVGVVATVRQEKPEQYLKVIASILPKEVEIKRTTLDGLTDAELTAGLDALRSIIGGGIGAGAATQTSAGEPGAVH